MTTSRQPKQATLNAFFSAEWAMEPNYLRSMSALVLELCQLSTGERRARLQAVEAERGERLEYTYNARIRDGVAILPVMGPISPYMDFFTYYSGGTALSVFARDFNAVLNDSRVAAIAFKVDSPGGAVVDVSPMSRMIFEARGKKPMTVHAGGMICSAAYWLGAAAGDIVVDDTTAAGSIGVYCAYLDTSKYDAKLGLREIVFRSSQSPKKNLDPATPAGSDSLQRRIDAVAQVFVEAVAEFRGVTVEKVLADFGQGDTLTGQAAVDAGLVDRVGSFEETLAELARHNGGSAGFTGSVVKGVVTAGAREDAKHCDDEEMSDECPDHPDGECPEGCPNYMPDDDEEADAGEQTSAPERHTPPAATAPDTLNQGAETMADEKEGTKPAVTSGEGGGAASGGGATQGAPGGDTDLRARLEAAERESAATREQLAAVLKEQRDGRFQALAAKWPGEAKGHITVLEALAAGEGGEKSAAFTAYVQQQNAIAEQVRTGKLFAQTGAETEPEAGADTPAAADQKLTARAKEIAKEKSITFEKAYVEACRENPDLAAQANTTVRGSNE